jgi:phosphoserine aminotransferase
MEKRVFNFAPGPAVLPLPVLEEAQRDLVALPGVGISILEISHRSPKFQEIIDQAEANLRKLLTIPDNYRVLFLQGGAQLQFAMIPMNLLHGSGRSADYVLTGSWAKTAMKEARTQGGVRVAWDGEPTKYRRYPRQDELNLDSTAAFVHVTSNETIQGIQLKAEPNTGDVPLVCDASSDFLCRPLPIPRYGILYACAQKNAGPAGVTIVIIRDDLVQKSADGLPAMLSYKVMTEGKSLHNTPPSFAVYVVKLVTDWLLRDIGGLDKMHSVNQQKAALLYEAVDKSNGFYRGHAEPESRSIMNVTFRLPSADLEAEFLKQAKQRDLYELKGHRSVGGCRASIYNAMPIEGVQALRDFMLEFCGKHAT